MHPNFKEIETSGDIRLYSFDFHQGPNPFMATPYELFIAVSGDKAEARIVDNAGGGWGLFGKEFPASEIDARVNLFIQRLTCK